jgi:Family of unknown function (DUF6788)
MAELGKLRSRWHDILSEMAELSEMRRGSIIEQFMETLNADGTKTRRGPYILYSYKEKNKTVSLRLSTELADIYRKQIGSFRRFQDLMQEMVFLGEKISNAVVHEEDDKKKLKSSSNRTKRYKEY